MTQPIYLISQTSNYAEDELLGYRLSLEDATKRALALCKDKGYKELRIVCLDTPDSEERWVADIGDNYHTLPYPQNRDPNMKQAWYMFSRDVGGNDQYHILEERT